MRFLCSAWGASSLLLLLVLLATPQAAEAQGRRRNRNNTNRSRGNGGFRKESINSVLCPKFERAESGDRVTVSYTGSLASDGSVFDSTEGKDPITFQLGAGLVIEGWERGIEGGCPGDKFKLHIPPELGYGDREIGGGLIPANSALVFEVTLEGVEKPSLTIETLESGDCGRNDDKRVRRKDNVTLHYTATLAADGKVFDSSYDRGVPLNMIVGDAGVKGWDDGVYKACVGEVRRVVVPYQLGYGEDGIPGVIPPKATIVLEMEILSIGNRVDLFLQQISQGLFG